MNVKYWKDGVLYNTDDFDWLIHYDEMQTYSVNGKTYMKVYSEPLLMPTNARGICKIPSQEGNEPRNYTLGIRKADGKVYVNQAEYLDHLSKVGFGEYEMGFLGNPGYVPYHLTADGELILYDYTMEVGDQYRHVDGYNDITVVSKDSVTLKDGKEHRRLMLSNGLVLVEDLGCINSSGLLLDYLNPIDENVWLYASLQWVITEDNYLYNKCARPTIAYDNGRLVFSCETPGAECVYEIKCADTGSGRGNEAILSQTYEIRVHATLEGWQDSDVATATIGWRNGRPVMEGFSSVTMDDGDGNADVNGDGKVDVADIATVISVMAGQQPE